MADNDVTKKERIKELIERALDGAMKIMEKGFCMTEEDRENVDTYLFLADGLRKLLGEETL